MNQGLQFDDDMTRRLEAIYMCPDVVRRRSRALEMLGLRPGEQVLDIGCGPGFLAAEMGAAVGPSGEVHAIDSSDSMIALAENRCRPQPWVKIRLGDAAALKVPDGGVDVVVSVQVHEYVPQIDLALEEVFRTVRPGGRTLIVATDWDSMVWKSRDSNRMSRVLSAFEEHLAHPFLPRDLTGLLQGVGFQVKQCDPFVMINRALDSNSYSYGLIDLIHRFVPGRRGVTQSEADAWAEDLRGSGGPGQYFFSLNQYFFLAGRA